MLTLGMLLILSASFLAVQLWSGKNSLRGAAVALEAPVVPPAIFKNKATLKTKEPSKKVQLSETLEKAEIVIVDTDKTAELSVVEASKESKEDKQSVEPASQVISQNESGPSEQVTAVETPVVAKTVVPAALPAVPQEKPKVAEVGIVNENEAKTTVSKKTQSLKSVRKNKKTAAIEVVPTEIPPEWNWFSAPLKIKFEQGKAEIACEAIPVTVAESRVSHKETAAASEIKTVPAVLKVAVELDTERPFRVALARMAKIKARHQKEKTQNVETPVLSSKISPASVQLRQAIRNLYEKLPASNENLNVKAVEDTEESEYLVQTSPVAVDLHNDNAEVSDSETGKVKAQSEYIGSGSSYSSRIISLLKRK